MSVVFIGSRLRVEEHGDPPRPWCIDTATGIAYCAGWAMGRTAQRWRIILNGIVDEGMVADVRDRPGEGNGPVRDGGDPDYDG